MRSDHRSTATAADDVRPRATSFVVEQPDSLKNLLVHWLGAGKNVVSVVLSHIFCEFWKESLCTSDFLQLGGSLGSVGARNATLSLAVAITPDALVRAITRPAMIGSFVTVGTADQCTRVKRDKAASSLARLNCASHAKIVLG